MKEFKTSEEIKAEVAKLREMKPWIPHHTMFGNDNYEKIEAQILALETMDDEADAEIEWPDEDQYEVLSDAQYAIRWKDGGESEPPSQNWASIDSRKKKAPEAAPKAKAKGKRK